MGDLKYQKWVNPGIGTYLGAAGPVLECIKDFCQWQGWTVDYQTDVEWDSGGVNGWEAASPAGDGIDFLQVQTQIAGKTYCYRLYARDPSDGKNTQLGCRGVQPGEPDYDVTDGTNDAMDDQQYCAIPYINAYQYDYHFLPDTAGVEEVHICGDSKFVFVNIFVKQWTYYQQWVHFAFGVPDVVPEFWSEDFNFWLGPWGGGGYDWDASMDDREINGRYSIHPMGNTYHHAMYWGTSGSRYQNSTTGDVNTDCYLNDIQTRCDEISTSYWVPIKDMLVDSPHSGTRYLHKPNWFIKHPDDVLWYHFASMPFYILNGEGLTPGERLIQNGNTYKCFPMSDPEVTDVWMAFEYATTTTTTTSTTTSSSTTTTTA
jgi:hypothetical protein